jgi:hypothetical protein
MLTQRLYQPYRPGLCHRPVPRTAVSNSEHPHLPQHLGRQSCRQLPPTFVLSRSTGSLRFCRLRRQAPLGRGLHVSRSEGRMSTRSRACQTYRAISHKVSSDTQFSLWLLSLMPLGTKRKIGACGGRARRSDSCRSRRSRAGKASSCPSGPSPFQGCEFRRCDAVHSPRLQSGSKSNHRQRRRPMIKAYGIALAGLLLAGLGPTFAAPGPQQRQCIVGEQRINGVCQALSEGATTHDD